jgi:hypothetical protein
MATITLNGDWQCKRGTAAAMTSNNPVLLAAEWGVETDTGKAKLGDGTTAWNSLLYSLPTPAQMLDLTDGGATTLHSHAAAALADHDHTATAGDGGTIPASSVIGLTIYAPTSAKYVVQEATGDLSAEQALGGLSTGIVKNTTTAGVGVLSIAAGTDLPDHTHAAGQGGAIGVAAVTGAMANPMTAAADLIVGGTAVAPAALAKGAHADGEVLTLASGTPAWTANAALAQTSALLSATHTDTTAGSVARGDTIIGSGATPKWAKLTKGSSGDVLTMGAEEPAWSAPSGGSHAVLSSTHSDTTAAAVQRGDILAGIGATPKWERVAKGAAATVLTMGANEPAWAVAPTTPLIVASFAAKGCTQALASFVLLANAPAGFYRANISMFGTASDAYSDWVHVLSGANTYQMLAIARSIDAGIPIDLAANLGNFTVEHGRATFCHPATGDISIDMGSMSISTGSFDFGVVLERLPDASGTAALFYLNATAATDVDAGATVTPTPTGPTHASGTSVSIQATASSGYYFVAWTGDDTSSTNPLVISMTAAKSITATFAAD